MDTRERVALRVEIVETGGFHPSIQCVSILEETPFTLKVTQQQAQELGAYLYRQIEIDALIRRDIDGRIGGGELLGFDALDSEDATEAWRQWYRENASEWDTVADVDAELRPGPPAPPANQHTRIAIVVPAFDHDFLTCGCPDTHEYLGIACAAVHRLDGLPGIKRYRCVQCGCVHAYKAIYSSRTWPRGHRPVLNPRGHELVVGETLVAVVVPEIPEADDEEEGAGEWVVDAEGGVLDALPMGGVVAVYPVKPPLWTPHTVHRYDTLNQWRGGPDVGPQALAILKHMCGRPLHSVEPPHTVHEFGQCVLLLHLAFACGRDWWARMYEMRDLPGWREVVRNWGTLARLYSEHQPRALEAELARLVNEGKE